MACAEIKIWWQCDQNFQGLFTSILMSLQKGKTNKMLLVAKTKNMVFHIIRKPNNQWFHWCITSMKKYNLLQKRSNYKVRLTSKILYRHPKTVAEEKYNNRF